MVNLQVIVRTESMPTIRMPTTLYSKYVLLISKDAYYTISMCYLTVRMADIVKNTPPKIHLAVWGGAYSSQEDFCPIEESAPQDLHLH